MLCCDNTIKNLHNRHFTQRIIASDINDFKIKAGQVDFDKLFENNRNDINKTLQYYMRNDLTLSHDDIKKVYKIIRDPSVILNNQSKNFLKFSKADETILDETKNKKHDEIVIDFINQNQGFGNKYRKCIDELSSYINVKIDEIYDDNNIECTHKIYKIIVMFITKIFDSDNQIPNFNIIEELIEKIKNDKQFKEIIDGNNIKVEQIISIVQNDLLKGCIIPTIINKIKEKTDKNTWKSIIDNEFNNQNSIYGLSFTDEEYNQDKDELNKYKEKYKNDQNNGSLSKLDFFIIRNRFEYWIFKILTDMKLSLVKKNDINHVEVINVITEERNKDILYYKCLIFTTFIIQAMIDNIELDDSGDKVVCYYGNILSTEQERNYINMQFIIKIIAIINYAFNYKRQPVLTYIQPFQINQSVNRLDLSSKISVINANINDPNLIIRIQNAIINNILLGYSIKISDVNKNSIFSLTHHRNINISSDKSWVEILNSFDYRYFMYLINDVESYNWMDIIQYSTNNNIIPWYVDDTNSIIKIEKKLDINNTGRKKNISYKKGEYENIMTSILDPKDPNKHDPLDYTSYILELIQFLIKGKVRGKVLDTTKIPIYKLDNEGTLEICKYLNDASTKGKIEISNYKPNQLEYTYEIADFKEMDVISSKVMANFYLSSGYCLALYLKWLDNNKYLDVLDIIKHKDYCKFLQAFSNLYAEFNYELFIENTNKAIDNAKKGDVILWNNMNSVVYYFFETFGNILLLDSCIHLGDNSIIGLTITQDEIL